MTYTNIQLEAIKIFWEKDNVSNEVHLDDLFRVSEERGLYCSVSNDGSYIALRDEGHNIDEDFFFDSKLSFLEQPSLPDILKLFK